MLTEFHDLWVNSQATDCPILTYDLDDIAGLPYVIESFEMTNPLSPDIAEIEVSVTSAFTSRIRIRATTMLYHGTGNIDFRVCGEETLSLVDTSPKVHVLAFAPGVPSSLADADRYLTIAEADFETWFTVGPVNDPCVVADYEAVPVQWLN